MELSNKGFAFLKSKEGCLLHSYQDSAGIWTIGWGSTMYKDGKRVGANETITQQQADDVLRWEVQNKTAGLVKMLSNVVLNQNQIDSLISFAYNCGIAALQTSTLLKRVRLNPGDPTIKDAFLMFDKIHVNGKLVESPGLKKRRLEEWNLYNSK